MSADTRTEDGRPLDSSNVAAYLHERGILKAPHGTARTLSGGVSNTVLLVETPERRVVVKQALGKLRVADAWFAPRTRAQTEAAALELIGSITPGAVPRVLDHDPARFALTIEAATPQWGPWKDRLLAGDCGPMTATWLGQVLRTWHDQTDNKPLPPQLEDTDAFRQLRIDPYFTTSAHRRPDLAPMLDRFATELTRHRRCLVSGDFSPKNVLIGETTGWVIDLEVAHRGDPAFDVAFLLNHLLLKAVHLPAHRRQLRRCADAFLAAYGTAPGTSDTAHLHGLIGCLLLARVIGSSPVEYLTPPQQRSVQDAATSILHRTPGTFDELWRGVVVP